MGAGPAGLLLSRLLHLHGISSVVLEARSRDHIELRFEVADVRLAGLTSYPSCYVPSFCMFWTFVTAASGWWRRARYQGGQHLTSLVAGPKQHPP